jgi:rhamnogalacturonyl hydrolase YesR
MQPRSSLVLRPLGLVSLAAAMLAPPLAAQESSLVRLGADGRLAYTANERGDRIPDFSGVGYRNSEVPIPDVRVALVVRPVEGDNTAHIQAAIDTVSAMPVMADGFRGAILFKAGLYPIAGPLEVRASGVVLRGEGADASGTHFKATGTKRYNLVHFTGTGGVTTADDSRRPVLGDYTPIGSHTLVLGDNHGFRTGEWVNLTYEATDAWIEHLGMAQYGWTPQAYTRHYERRVTRVLPDRIEIDAPVVDPIDPRHTRASVARITGSGRIENCGIEHIHFTSTYAHDEDEDHGWTAVVFNHVKNAWARHLDVWYFGYSAVDIVSRDNLWITVEHSSMREHKSRPVGGRRYAFASNGQRTLVRHCFTSTGRHDYVSGSRTSGPNVVYDCVATEVVGRSDIGPHHRWTAGTLYDRVVTDKNINVRNRRSSGTGHGWVGGQIMLWNCVADEAIVQSPPAPYVNWAIGVVGRVHKGTAQDTPAFVESVGEPIRAIPSLFLAQLHDRLNPPVRSAATDARPAIAAAMRRVFDWQAVHPWSAERPIDHRHGTRGWVFGAFLTGVMEAWRATGDTTYLDFAKNAADTNSWLLGPRETHADDFVIAQTYLELNAAGIPGANPTPTRVGIDRLLTHDITGRKLWWWCDALYMAPPAMVNLARQTGDERYIDAMDRWFWDSYDYLYDPAEKLFYRDDRFFNPPDGRKIFWSRGNGWVLAGIARILDHLPPNHPSRERYVELFREMAARIVELQPADGLWRANLLYPEDKHGEASGSAFFCYAIAWGVDQGILPAAEYRPAAERTWQALQACIAPDGRLGWVQPIGSAPDAYGAETWQEYGTGAFLAAGAQLLRLP